MLFEKKAVSILKSSKKITTKENKMIKEMNYDIFCYLNNSKQIALTKENKVNFLKNFNLPMIKEMKEKSKNKSWKLLKNYKKFYL